MKRKILWGVTAVAAVALAIYFLIPRPTPGRNFYRVLCLGDSLTESDYGRYTGHLGRLFKNAGMAVRVHSAARPGNTSGEYLRYLEATPILEKIKPHIAVVMLGTNDVRIDGDHTPLDRYVDNMEGIVEILLAHRNGNGDESPPAVFIVTVPPIFHCDLATFDTSSMRRIRLEIVPAIERLARQRGLGLIDVFAFFEKRPQLLPGVHPNAAGYRAMADFIFGSLAAYIREKQKR